MDELISVRVNTEMKNKAVYVLKCKGKNLSQAVREVIEEYAKEFDKKSK